MKTSLLVIGLCLLSCALASAQTTHFTRSLSVNASVIQMGNVAYPGYGYGITYARHFANDRFTVGGRLGYADAPGRNSSYYTDSEEFHRMAESQNGLRQI